MPKRYSDGHFLRRIRRTLMPDGLARDIRLVPKPVLGSSSSLRVVEIKTTVTDGSVVIRHHNTGTPGTPADVERICAEHREAPGVNLKDVQTVLSEVGKSLIAGNDPGYAVMRYSSEFPLMLHVEVVHYDIACRPHQRCTAIPLIGQVPSYWQKNIDLHQLELELDLKRRGRSGQPPKLMIDGGLAALIRQSKDAVQTLAKIKSALEAYVDQAAYNDDHSVITIDTVNFTVDGISITAGQRGLRLKNHHIGRAVINGKTITLPQQLPETVLVAISGKKLHQIVSPAPLRGDATILSAQSRARGTALTLKLKSVTYDELMREISEP